MGLSLRPFEESDREAAVGLFVELNQHEFEISGDRRTDRGGAEICVDDVIGELRKGAVATVAESDGSVVGLMVWSAKTDNGFMIGSAQRYGLIDDLVVTKTHRGRGIGAMLLMEAERLTRAAGLSRLKLGVLSGNDGAARAYARAGYRDYSRTMIKELP